MNKINATASPGAPQASILAFVPRAKAAAPGDRFPEPVVSIREWTAENRRPTASDYPYREPWYILMHLILDGYREKLRHGWSVTYAGLLIMRSNGDDGWSSRNKSDAYSCIIDLAQLIGLGAHISPGFVQEVYYLIDNNLPSPGSAVQMQ